MTCLDPNSKLGRAIRRGQFRAEKVVRRPGEDAADAFIRGMWERRGYESEDAFFRDMWKERQAKKENPK